MSLGPTGYESFLPGPGYQFHDEGSEVGGPGTQEARTVAVEVGGRLDIPLFFRSKNPNAKATAKLIRVKDGPWMFAYVDGNPVLRAVLYEALREAANVSSVENLMSELKTNELLVSLRQRSVLSDSGRATDDDIRLEGNKLIVEHVVYGSVPASGVEKAASYLSLALPDAEADRARLRDRMQLARLETSAAFIAPIRNRRL